MFVSWLLTQLLLPFKITERKRTACLLAAPAAQAGIWLWRRSSAVCTWLRVLLKRKVPSPMDWISACSRAAEHKDKLITYNCSCQEESSLRGLQISREEMKWGWAKVCNYLWESKLYIQFLCFLKFSLCSTSTQSMNWQIEASFGRAGSQSAWLPKRKQLYRVEDLLPRC